MKWENTLKKGMGYLPSNKDMPKLERRGGPSLRQIIDMIPENTKVEQIATEIGRLLKNDYGKHNYDKFMKVLLEEMKYEDE